MEIALIENVQRQDLNALEESEAYAVLNSKSLLFNNSSELKKEITKLKEKIYYVKEKGNTKSKIIGQLENLISST